MKKTNAFFYVLLAIIIAGIFSFLLLEKGEKLKISFLIQKGENTIPAEDYGFIYQEILNHSELPMHQLDYEVSYFEDFSDFEEQLKKVVKSGASNVLICHFQNGETYNAFLKLNSYPSPLYITLYESEEPYQHQQKELLHLFPPINRLGDAVNELFALKDNHSILVINNKKNHNRNSVFQNSLKGQKTTIGIEETEGIKPTINSVGEILSTMNPDYIVIDLNEKETIALLEKIVGFPRDKIILLFENTSEKVGYYTGSNSYGVNGITFSNPTQINGFNNKKSLLKLITQTLAQSFVHYQKVGITQLKQYLEDYPNSTFDLEDNVVITPIFRVSFTEKGLKVIDKVYLTNDKGEK